ncbi:hypothetical protein SAMN05444166_5219 [Singulisphaera sp. GP187]|uniref:hypothetical protein n=1 Tax=Singulisphaera sp. GP187 TaxID=1882752 RepID=UPI00092B363B|nr:hypothetical protein [Singulisphaera sp. GP187]SIO56326.1 hypothetical protein SAMN05444166_5219 [Singulisphaera sp. GP187]
MIRRIRCSTSSSGRALGALAALALAISWVSPEAQAAPPSVSELTAAIRHNREAFFAQKSYKFQFTVNSEIQNGGTFAYKSFNVTNIRRGADLHTIVLYPKGTLRGQESLPEYVRHLIFYKNAAIDTNDSFMEISPSIFTQHFTYHQYTDYQHIDAYKDLPAAAGNLSPFEISQPFLPETVEKSPGSYRVRATPEVIDGASCWVLERPGADEIWVDLDGLIHQRLVYWGKGQPRSVLSKSLDFKTVAEGLKLPMKLVVDHYTNPSSDPKESWGKIAYELTIDLKSHEFNTAKDEDFLIKPSAGCAVNDYIRRVQYRIPAEGEKPFEVAMTIANLEKTPRSYYFILANGLLFGLLLVVLTGKRVLKAYRLRATSLGGEQSPANP